jgi:hypothetical protein
MILRRCILAIGLLCLPVTADAVTVRDIIELTKAGLSDDIITALIDADRTMFTLDADQIVELKRAGVTPVVLLKMVRSRREFEPPVETPVVYDPHDPPPPVAPDDPPPQIVVIGAQPEPPPPPAVMVPYYVPVSIWGTRPRHGSGPPAAPFMPADAGGFGRFINDGWRGRR